MYKKIIINICLIFQIIIMVSLLIAFCEKFSPTIDALAFSESYKKTIVIDAGHGGRDGGCIGVNGTIEKEINLTYATALKEVLENAGYNIIMTRTDDNALYDENANNKKLNDMKNRCKIINETKPILTISIHMNSFPDSSCKGASIYYKIDDEASKNVAYNINKYMELKEIKEGRNIKAGDFYILNCSSTPAILVECGFLSNKEEEIMLNTDEYRNKIINSIYAGIVLTFGNYGI